MSYLIHCNACSYAIAKFEGNGPQPHELGFESDLMEHVHKCHAVTAWGSPAVMKLMQGCRARGGVSNYVRSRIWLPWCHDVPHMQTQVTNSVSQSHLDYYLQS